VHEALEHLAVVWGEEMDQFVDDDELAQVPGRLEQVGAESEPASATPRHQFSGCMKPTGAVLPPNVLRESVQEYNSA
jgi:hypothetical protein